MKTRERNKSGIEKVTSKQFELTFGGLKWHKNQLSGTERAVIQI